MPLLIIGVLVTILLVTQKSIMNKKYIDFLSGLGFGEIVLSQMSTKELHAVFTYITEYTRKGRTVTEGSDLDKTLLQVARKYEIINYI